MTLVLGKRFPGFPWSVRMVMLQIFSLSILFFGVNGEWGDPPYELMPNLPDGFKLEGSRIFLPEEVETGGGLPLLLLHVDDLDEVIIEQDLTSFSVSSTIDEDNKRLWHFNVNQKFDFEKLDDSEKEIFIVLNLKGGSFQTQKYIYVEIVDINDNSPEVVSQTPDPIDPIEEFEILTDPILTIIATDADVADNDDLKYELTENGVISLNFNVNDNGEVFMTQELDYAKRSIHRLNIKISDRRPPIFSTFANATVFVKDTPNLPPLFTKLPTINSVKEKTTIGSTIGTVEARDQDYGLNFDVEYELEDPLGYFAIDAKSGEIKVAKEIDADKDEVLINLGLTYNFTVIAKEVYDETEYPNLPVEDTQTSTPVTFAIQDINDHPPLICTQPAQEIGTCKGVEDYEFEIFETDIGQVTLPNGLVIRVVDLDATTAYSRYTAAIETDDDIIKKAFSISPSRGMGEENFFIIISDTNAIDFENGEWGQPKTFKIKFTGEDNEQTHEAIANFKVTVIDVNDNSPEFSETTYTFKVCENTPDGTPLKNIQPTNIEYPNSCLEHLELEPIIVSAEDRDISDEYGKLSIRYKWSGREPPVELDNKTGAMIMRPVNGIGFDYERLKKEIFIVEAIDEEGEGRSTTATVVFEILDRNDEPVDLRFMNGYRKTIKENDTSVDPVLEGIIAEDVDETGNITWSLNVTTMYTASRVFLENGTFISQYKKLETNSEIKADISKWFKLKVISGETENRRKEFNLVLGDELPDRDPYGQEDIDQVELIISVNDSNTETGKDAQAVTQLVTITIQDINDNPPQWRDGESDNFIGIITETEFDSEDDDTSSDREREIYTLTGVTDRDRNPTFFFSLSNDGDCDLGENICSNIRDMFELSSIESKSGVTTLRRRKGKKIDRDDRDYFLDDNDILNITIIVSDEAKNDPNHQLQAKLQIKVEDRNDHTPQFNDKDEYYQKPYYVNEIANNAEVVTIQATDKDHPDKFGKVSYRIVEGETIKNGTDQFAIDLDSGKITAKDGCCEWFDGSTYRLEVRAIDYYRESSSSGSNWNSTFVNIFIIDTNNNPPEFLTEGGDTPENPLVDELERGPEINKVLATIRIQDKDDPKLPNGNFKVDFEVDRDPATSDDLKSLFKLELPEDGERNIRDLKVFPTRSFTGLWGNYTITFKATDGDEDVGSNTTSAIYVFRIRNENLNAPEFIYPAANEPSVLISIGDSKPGKELVNLRDGQPTRAVEAEDKDKGSGENGEIVFSMESDEVCRELFNLHEETGVISLKTELDQEIHANKQCNLKITAKDKGSVPNSASAELVYILLNDRNTNPAFAQRLMTVHMLENCSQSPSTPFDPAIDEDKENGNCFDFNPNYCEIFYILSGGDSDMFTFKETENGLQLELKDGQEIDRETKDIYDVSIYATNDPDEVVNAKRPEDVLDEDNEQWAVIRIIVDDRLDTPPKFDGLSNGILTSGFTTRVQTDALIGEVKATDDDLNDRVTFKITSDFTVTPGLPAVDPEIPPFELVDSEKLNTANIKLKFDPQPNFKGHYAFQITATDSVGEIARVQCQIYIVAEKNVVNFYFTSPTLDDMKNRQVELSSILSSAFNYSCSVDRVFVNAAGSNGAITVETHFVNTENNEPVISDYIEAQQFKPVFYKGLVETLSGNGFALQRIGESDEIPESDIGQIVTFVLIGGVAVLTISLLILAATCFYNNKSLKLRVRALTANTFGSQQSDLNRIGMANEAPNTNAFAVEGSNPIWTVDGDRRNIPDFDTDSVGSGGSVLIGAEDEDYFQKSSKNPMFQGEDVLANYGSDNEISDNRSYNNGEPDYAQDNNSVESINMNTTDSPFTTKITRNPLMNFGESQKSIDVDDDFGDEAFQFEANTDGGLF